MPTVLVPIQNHAINYLKNHSSTSHYHINTVGQFFTYLKDSLCSIFNTEHKFAHLGNKSIPEFNLEHIQTDLSNFLKNPNLNNQEQKDHNTSLKYLFEYLHVQAGIIPNLHNIYYSGNLEPNELITQLINYGDKQKNGKLTTDEQKYKSQIKTILTQVNSNLKNPCALDDPKTNDLKNRITLAINTLN